MAVYSQAKAKKYGSTGSERGGNNTGGLRLGSALLVPILLIQGEIPRYGLNWLDLAMVIVASLKALSGVRRMLSRVKTYGLVFAGWIMVMAAHVYAIPFLEALLLGDLFCLQVVQWSIRRLKIASVL